MLCYEDKTFCSLSEECKNEKCERKLKVKQTVLPVAYTNFNEMYACLKRENLKNEPNTICS